jgi:hypothetical protein
MKLVPNTWWVVTILLLGGSAFVVAQLILPNTSTTPTTDTLPVVTGTLGGENAPEPVLTGNFTDTPGHPGAGNVSVYQIEANQILRLTNFSSTAGPDLFVYLATDKEATEFINLGPLKSTQGDQNYDIPAGTNVSEYPYVLIWCKRFGVLFMTATLTEAV